MVWDADYHSSRIGGIEEPKAIDQSPDPITPLKSPSKMVEESHHSLLALNQPRSPRTNEPLDRYLDVGTSTSQLLALRMVLYRSPGPARIVRTILPSHSPLSRQMVDLQDFNIQPSAPLLPSTTSLPSRHRLTMGPTYLSLSLIPPPSPLRTIRDHSLSISITSTSRDLPTPPYLPFLSITSQRTD